jgi:hypothetical protein
MKLTKLDAARRQLDTAIELYFGERDPVAIHALAAGAFEVVTALCVHTGRSDELFDLVVPDRRGEVLRWWRAAQNFVKHADRDPDAVLEFDPEFTDVVLMLAVRRYSFLSPATYSMRVMHAWFFLHHADLIIETDTRLAVEGLAVRAAHLDRPAFWRLLHAASDLETFS